MDDSLDQLSNSKYFTTLDLAAGYWQVLVDPPSREKTAFVTHSGLFEFSVMPFGLKNAQAFPATHGNSAWWLDLRHA